MNWIRTSTIGLAIVLSWASAADAQMYPRVMVTPRADKPIEIFHDDERACRDYADRFVGGQVDAAGDVIGGAFVGTVLGALLGLAAGGRHGVGLGAAAGAVAGTAVGAGMAEGDQAQRRQAFDDAYERCMYAHDDLVPGEPDDDAPPPPPRQR